MLTLLRYLRGLFMAAQRALNLSLARRRCALGRHSVVYEVDRIQPSSDGPSTIRVGDHCHVRGELMVFPGGAIEIGDYCYVGEQTRVWAAASIRIGDRVLIAHQTTILDSLTHPISAKLRHEQYAKIITTGHPRGIDLDARPVVIEHDAWVGCNCAILRGVTIGAGAVVGAGSVVTRDVAPYTVVAGNPARFVRELTPEERDTARSPLEDLSGASRQ